MSQENKEIIRDGDEIKEIETNETASTSQPNSRVKPMYIALGILGALVLGLILFLFLRIKESGGGQPVPAPRTVSFGESNNGGTSMTSGEQTITLEPEQIERAGIKTEVVGEQLSTESATAASTGVVQANAYRETPVISLAGGVVRQINVELGQQVNRGQTVAVIFSEDLSGAQSRYLSLLTERETARQNFDRETKLLRISPASNAELDEATAKLKTAEAELDEHHKHHERTIKLIAIGAVSREELEQATTKLRRGEAELVEARKRYERAVQIARINPAARASLEQSSVRLRNAESELSAVRQRLLLLGLSPQKIDALRFPNQISSELALTAPASGTVTARMINTGEVVEANKELLRVTDLSTVWVIAQVYEKDLGRIRQGSGASVTTAAFPDKVLRGQVAYIDPNISAETRTAQVRIEVANPGQNLKIGMYVNVAFGSLGNAENTMPVVPVSAVQNINNQQAVFVAAEQPNIFVVRFVRLAPESNGLYPVIEGITVGDRIVTEGSFLLRAEWLKLHPGGN